MTSLTPRRRLSGLLATVMLILGLSGAAGAQSLLENGHLDRDLAHWEDFTQASQRTGVEAGRLDSGGVDDSGCLHISVTDEHGGAVHMWRTRIADFAPDSAIRVTARARGRGVRQLVALCVQGWDEDTRAVIEFATTQETQPLQGDFEWTELETYLRPRGQVETYFLLAFIQGRGEVWFDDFDVELVEDIPGEAPPPVEVDRPGIFQARGHTRLQVTGARSRPYLLMPVPLVHAGQTPLTWSFTADPPGVIASIAILPDDLDNHVAHIRFNDLPPGAAVELEWKSLVLAGVRDFSDVPAAAPLPDEWPEEARPWLEPSWAVQSDDPRIVEAATALQPRADAIDIIEKTMVQAGRIFQQQTGRCTSLDAVQALEKQGSCTSCANLVAALLRANGLPTRILGGYPTWAGPLQTHYTVETWIPGYGWYPIESTMLRHPLQPYEQIQVSLAPVAHEEESRLRAAAAPGVPYLSLTEYVDYDHSFSHSGILERAGCDHEATIWQLFEAPTDEGTMRQWRELEQLARAHWQAWLESGPTAGPGESLASPLTPDDLMMVTTSEELRDALGL